MALGLLGWPVECESGCLSEYSGAIRMSGIRCIKLYSDVGIRPAS